MFVRMAQYFLQAVFIAILGATLALPATGGVPENLYQGELVNYPGPWAFKLGRPHIILVSDEELEMLSDPDKVFNMSTGLRPHEESLRTICERGKAAGLRTLVLAFDHFFSQYRPGQEGKPRRLTPDMDEYVQRIAQIAKFAEGYGLGLELSLLSPLEIGPAYRAQTGESGMWMHYRKGVRDTASGAFSVQLWQQQRWSNNKGPIDIEDAGVRVFAFSERSIGGTPYRVVDPDSIVEITDAAKVEVWDGASRRAGDFRARRVRIYGEGRTDIGGRDKVLVVQMYRTPELDYFSDKAMPFLTGLLDKYVDAGVKLNALYSDEMHIQQDWGYFNHHDNGEFTTRYVSHGLANAFADRYGEPYRDFAKYLVYFCYGQEDTAGDLSAKEGVMHVFGDSPEAIRQTALFRARYYHLLQDGVVDLFVAAKRHAEERIGYRLETRAHATWAESPTIDKWNTGREPQYRNHYEYTSNFVWSDTVHQAASACYDYFKWGEYLTGTGNDHPEGGWIDRDYLALALACSTGIVNEVPYSYCAHWGMPGEIAQRRQALVDVFGAAASPGFMLVEEAQHRDCDVLMLYPIDLVAAEERFGSWMTQYGYANVITQAMLLERGKVQNGAIELAGRRFTTLATLFEPFPKPALLDMIRELSAQGGRVVWSGPPPVIDSDGSPVTPAWSDLFGVDYTAGPDEGLLAPGREVRFAGPLAAVPTQTILTDFMVDRVYPVTPREGTQPAATVKDTTVGTVRAVSGGGSLTFLGFRPRDDQAASLGYETRTWFEVLNTLGAYAPTGRFDGVNDNTEFVSRTTDFLACRFPNGTVAIAPHFKSVEEGWPGGFARDPEKDKAYMEQHPLPPNTIHLSGFKVNGHSVTYDGVHAVAFRMDAEGRLLAFAGSGSNAITVDGQTFTFADAPLGGVAWAPVAEARKVAGGAVAQLLVYGSGVVRMPAAHLSPALRVVAEGATPGSRGADVASTLEDGTLTVTVPPELSGRWLYIISE
ncbi:MAG: hypothetical protein IT364_27205 [Candidatus Hydrogenedentes bacterium]|nr:hypothetical protein [Candidatus Hydrogenedentota bacterium]